MLGKFYGVGVGPGDPELMTLKACRVLADTEVVCIPVSQPGKPSIALQIASQSVKKDWNLLELHLPMTRDSEKLERYWQEAAMKVGQVLTEGRNVAFITLGDPSFYSTFIYLARRLKQKYTDLNTEVIPGVSAPNILAAYAQVPLAESDEKFLIIPAINDLDEISEALDNYDNVLLLKVGKAYPEILAILKEKSLENNTVFGSRCGFEDGFISTQLEEIANTSQDYLSTMLIKKGGLE